MYIALKMTFYLNGMCHTGKGAGPCSTDTCKGGKVLYMQLTRHSYSLVHMCSTCVQVHWGCGRCFGFER